MNDNIDQVSPSVGNPWPELVYNDFAPTAYLLHMTVQMIGKLKLSMPFEAHWDHVALWVTSYGLTTGLIPYQSGGFSVDIDLITHRISCNTSWGQGAAFQLEPMSVAQCYKMVFAMLHSVGINLRVNPMPQEVQKPIPFDEDYQQRPYEGQLANRWWHLLISSQRIMQIYHATFIGRSPAIGLMWGTFDLRDVRYNSLISQPDQQPKMDYIRRNALDAALIEIGWWPGNTVYPYPAYYAFTYPQPPGIERAIIKPEQAQWNSSLGEFILHYDVIQHAENPDNELLTFFESTYAVGAELLAWDNKLISSGTPV